VKRPDLAALTLSRGAHRKRENGMCVMEAAAWYAGQPHTDAPPCVSGVIRTILIAWNDALPEAERQRLKGLIPILPGTADAGPAAEDRRSWMAADWLVRTHAPAWLRLARFDDHAAALEGLPELTTDELAHAAMPIIKTARAAGGDLTAHDESGHYSAVRAESDSAADYAARSSAYSVASPATCPVACDAAYRSARSGARSAARESSHSAADYLTASSAALDALAPTVAALQDSTYALVERMCAVGRDQ